MDREKKRAHWSQQVAAFERSGSSRRAWCEAQGVKASTLEYWRRRLRSMGSSEGRDGFRSLMPIVVRTSESEAASATTVALVLPDGLRLSVPIGIDARWLAGLLRELGAC
jgi:transposase-like protein